ncbi:hypothetical protein [Kineococcus sp. SYSU DK003]|uniref:hypothetical protein n=1 Tax=Kineococcus sp. SYSU DK003 TaxID=3383124 RepID=UPI003D7F1871
MKRVQPYMVPPDGVVSAAPWERYTGEWAQLESWIEEWDYRTVLRLRSAVEVDEHKLRAGVGLGDGTPLLWSFGWIARDSQLVTTVTSELRDGRGLLELDISSDRAGSTIVLGRKIVLGRSRMHARAGEPRWAGSVLWADETSVRLTGHGSAFPTEIVDFRAIGRDPGASWFLELPSSPDVAAMGSFLLLINSADSTLVSAVSTSKSSEAQTAVSDSMIEGVVEEVVRWALSRWPELADCEEDSAGFSARILTVRVLPDADRWTGPDVDSMALKAAIVSGARGIGFGRRLT